MDLSTLDLLWRRIDALGRYTSRHMEVLSMLILVYETQPCLILLKLTVNYESYTVTHHLRIHHKCTGHKN